MSNVVVDVEEDEKDSQTIVTASKQRGQLGPAQVLRRFYGESRQFAALRRCVV